MKIVWLLVLVVGFNVFAEDRPPTFPPEKPSTPPITFPDLPTAEAKYKELEKKLAACEAEKTLFNASACPKNSAPVFCHANGTVMSYVGNFKCNVSLLANCQGDRIGKVFCAACQEPVYQPPVYVNPQPQIHGQIIYTYPPYPSICRRSFGRCR